jgi:hypothetical protein
MSTETSPPPDSKQAWHRRASTLWAIAGCVLLALVVVVALATGNSSSTVPADGSDCVSASSSEIRAWVKSHEKEIPSSIPLPEVVDQVEKACEGSLAIFNSTLLTNAVNSAAVARSNAASP